MANLPLAEWWYNTTYHSSLQSTPYEVFYGQPAPTHVPYLIGDSHIEAVDRTLRAREEAITQIKANLLTAQNRMKQLADTHRTEREFEVNDWVYLKMVPFRQSSLGQRKTTKLSPRFAGPFRIIKRVGPVAYQLELPEGARIHDTFHVSCLKKKKGFESVNSSVPGFIYESAQEYIPEEVLDRRAKKVGNRAGTF